METPQGKLDAARARGYALLCKAKHDSDYLDEENGFTFGDLRTLLRSTDMVWLGHEMPHTRSNVR